MDQQVSALVVARSGGDHLQRTLTALAAQTRQPDAIIVVDCTNVAGALDTVSDDPDVRIDGIVRVSGASTFGEALRRAEETVAADVSDEHWLWMLGHDTAPEAGALESLLAAVETSPSVAVAGPKIVDWNDPTLLTEFGQTLSPWGATIYPVDHELDQAQHDRLSDVLGVSPAGLFVRHTVWRELGGFDRALARADAGLDLSVRARLAGHRVVLVPAARVAEANDGVTHARRRRRTGHVSHFARRSAQLHRRLVYAPLGAVPLHWLSLVPLALLRCLLALVQKQPNRIVGEIGGALVAAWRGIRVVRARRRLARSKRVAWSSVNALRMSGKQARRLRMLHRDDAASLGAETGALTFFSGSGVWTVVLLAAVSFGLTFAVVGDTSIHHGGLAPLSRLSQLWHNAFWGWHDAVGGVSAADPFGMVLALLGSTTFWNPSLAVVLLVVAAIPLAGMGAWFCAARLTRRESVRVLFAVLWALAPPLLAALADGRPGALIAHVALPWLVFSGLGASRSLVGAAATSLLAAVVAASAPSTIPALALLWIALLVTSGRRAGRVTVVPIATVALFAPLAWQQIARGTPWALAADPGAGVAAHGGDVWQRALGFPDGLGQGGSVVNLLRRLVEIPAWPPLAITALLLVPLGLLVLVGILWGRWRTALWCGALVVAGIATATAAAAVSMSVTGAQPVGLWPGNGLSLYWLGAVGLACLGLLAMRRAVVVCVAVSTAAALVALVPLASGTLSSLQHSHDAADAMPALVEAHTQKNPQVGVLVLVPQADDALRARVLRGGADTIDTQSTLAATDPALTDNDRTVSTLAANLASPSGYDASTDLSRLGIGFVLVRPVPTDSDLAPTHDRVLAALDANAALTSIGTTDSGSLWTYAAGAEAAAPPSPADDGLRAGLITAQLIVFGVLLLLAVPTGRRAPLRPRRPGRRASPGARARAAGRRGESRGGRSQRAAETSETTKEEDDES